MIASPISSIKPIPTKYKGITFRSRLEARWAVFFDALDLQWEYEREGYDLLGVWYLPDFWLADVNMWAEVKPTEFDKTALNLAKQLAAGTGYPVLMLAGAPADQPYLAVEPSPNGGVWYMDYCLTNYHGYPKREHRFYSSPCGEQDSHYEDVAQAAMLARAERFGR